MGGKRKSEWAAEVFGERRLTMDPLIKPDPNVLRQKKNGSYIINVNTFLFFLMKFLLIINDV